MPKAIHCRVTKDALVTEGSQSYERMFWWSLDHNMSDERIRTWVAALRSGNYEQIEGELFGPGMYEPTDFTDWDEPDYVGYCCLGVLGSTCGIADADLRIDSLLSEENADTTGMIEDTASDGTTDGSSEATPRVLQDLLSAMNDDGWTFAKIADWIEENLLDDDDEIRI